MAADDVLTIRHNEQNGIAKVQRFQFDEVYKDRGWELVDDDEAQLLVSAAAVAGRPVAKVSDLSAAEKKTLDERLGASAPADAEADARAAINEDDPTRPVTEEPTSSRRRR